MTGLDICIVPILSDNYVYILRDVATGEVGVVDPGEAAPVQEVLDKDFGGQLNTIFLTHHHWDHTGGVGELAQRYGAHVIASASEREKFGEADRYVTAGEIVSLGASHAEILSTPGHTNGHISYVFAGDVFSGDALFVCGCGRMFEGNPSEYWAGLKALRGLGDEKVFWCGHEYTSANIAFALSIDPENSALQDFASQVQALRDAGQPTIPQKLGEERRRNPFLRADSEEFAQQLGLEGAKPEEVFAWLRQAKDAF